MHHPTRARTRALLALLATLALAPAIGAQQATTTGTVRGTVLSPDRAPAEGVAVMALNVASGTHRSTYTDARGRYNIPFLEPGVYTIRAQRIGFRPTDRTDLRISLGEVVTVDFQLEAAATQLGAMVIRGDATALIEPTKTGTSTRILEEQLRALPTSDRNFKNLVVLTPGTSDVGASGAGGGQSIGGGRTASSNLLVDGVNNNESYFGGDARGGDRLPFSYSIEAVKEIQVITAGYDVERGQFTGGTVNAVTKSGTNTFQGSVFDYERGDKRFGLTLTGNDFLDRAPRNYRRQQYGGSVGGPILKDKLHFFVTLDRQVGNEPKPVLQTGSDSATIRNAGISPATLALLQATAKNVYGYDLSSEIGSFQQNIDESAVFGRLDWQVNEKHTLTFRDNYLDFRQTNDRLTISPSTNDLTSNAGPYKERTNSAVLALTSVFSNALSNELRTQYARDRKPRPAAETALGGALPSVTVNNIVSSAGTASVQTQVNFGSDIVLHANNLEQDTYEVLDNLRYVSGDHTFKVGTDLNKVHVFNRFFLNSLGSYTYNSLADFQNNVPLRFTRALPVPGKGYPDALFDVYEYALYAQDEFQVTPKLFLTYGLRYDNSRFPTTPEANPLLASSVVGVRSDYQPSGKGYISPRFGFTFDPAADGQQVIRGGTGLFYGRSPYVLYGNTLSSTGLTQLDLNCTGATVPKPNFPLYATTPDSIPTACVGGGAATASKASPVVFSPDFQQTRAWKSNLALDRLITEGWRVTVEGIYTRIANDYTVQDVNLDATQKFTIEGGIPVFEDPTKITATGLTNIAFTRRDPNFNNIFVQESKGKANSLQGVIQLRGATPWGALLTSYTHDRTRDVSSSSCCIAGGDLFNSGRTFGTPNDLTQQYGPASYSRTHSFVFSPTFNLKYGIQLSGIYRGYSGLPWTPRYRGDVNGDGVSNDRLYIPTETELASYQFAGADSVTQRAAFGQKIADTECLNANRGTVIDRNACRNPWQHIVDARVAKTFTTVRGQGLELSVDFFNLLNGLNRDWGKRFEVQSTGEQALQPVGFNTTTSRYVYRYNATNFAALEPSAFGLSQQFQVQLGARYAF